jgi:multidrug efflux pump subunit AcrA (membrane-fusion protein)
MPVLDNRGAVAKETRLQEAAAAAARASEEAVQADGVFVAQQARLEALMEERARMEQAVRAACEAVDAAGVQLEAAAQQKKAAEAELEVGRLGRRNAAWHACHDDHDLGFYSFQKWHECQNLLHAAGKSRLQRRQRRMLGDGRS